MCRVQKEGRLSQLSRLRDVAVKRHRVVRWLCPNRHIRTRQAAAQ